MSSDEEIAEVFYQDIQDKTNLVRNKSGLLPFLNDPESYKPDDLESLDGFRVVNFYEGMNTEDRNLLKDLYCQVIEEEKEETEE